MRYSPRSSVAWEDCASGMILPFRYVIWYAVTLAFGRSLPAAFCTRPVIVPPASNPTETLAGFAASTFARAWRPGISKKPCCSASSVYCPGATSLIVKRPLASALRAVSLRVHLPELHNRDLVFRKRCGNAFRRDVVHEGLKILFVGLPGFLRIHRDATLRPRT